MLRTVYIPRYYAMFQYELQAAVEMVSGLNSGIYMIIKYR